MSAPNPVPYLLAFKILAEWFPAPPLEPPYVDSPEKLKEQGKKWNRMSGILCLCLIVGCSFLFGFVARTIADKQMTALGQPLFLIRAEPWELWFWSIFLASLLGLWLSMVILRLVFGRERYGEFIMVVSNCSPYKIHSGKMAAFLFFVASPPLLGLLVLRVDSYTAFTQDAMVINATWSLGKVVTHPYQDIRGIYSVAGFHARFEDVAKPRHALVFSDGTVWTTDEGMRAARPQSDLTFIQHVAEKSGHQIVALNFLEDAPR